MLVPMLSLVLAVGAAGPVWAQLHGPPPGLPELHLPGAGMPELPPVPAARQVPTLPMIPAAPALAHLDDLLRGPLALTRQAQVNALLRAEPRSVTLDPRGAPVLRGEFLALGLSAAQRAAVQADGFAADSQASADAALGLDLVILRDTRGRSEAQALRALQQAAPGARFAYQHLYLPAGGSGDGILESAAPPGSGSLPHRVGLVDGGVDPAAPALARARIEPYGCQAAVSRHGTAVATRLVDGDPDTLYAANLWCGGVVGGETSGLVAALAWMAREGVPVINISLVGPDNPVLARAVQVMIASGHVLVAAVGNDGPAAPPLFPAAYPGVIGVSGVDAHDRVLPESASGSQVAFCASGVIGRGHDTMRGTSFASPIVARRAAQLLDAPQPGAAAQVLQRLAAEARALGSSGRDARCGFGLLSP